MKKRLIITLAIITALVFVDQIVKIIISNNFAMKETVVIINNVLFIYPTLNTGLMGPLIDFFSWFGADLSGFIQTSVYSTIFTLIAFGLYFLLWRYVIYVHNNNKVLIYCIFVFTLSGVICSWIDTMFWGGSLDYIGLLRFPYIFDLKDVYMTVSAGLLILFWLMSYLIKYVKLSKEERKKEDKEVSLFKWLKNGCPLERETMQGTE
jgi:signal peptidase II